ncbi:ATP-binding protein [Streptomyces mutabilis]|uniref:ATP-binding protein n=1 Tax=Streptomyces mutabilis TaxID=67332 RepID=UPI0038B5456C
MRALAALPLTLFDDQAVLDVTDDGHGFEPAALSDAPVEARRHGLPAMRARLRQLGGTLTVESAPGEGTALSAAVPLEAPRPDPSDTAGRSSVTASAVPYGAPR